MSESKLNTMLKDCKVVDLTHVFDEDVPHAADMPRATIKKIYDFEKDGFQAHQYTVAGQWGTHIDPPIHFVEKTKTLDEIPASDFVLPLCVFDVREECREDHDYLLTVDRVMSWEKQYGDVDPGSFVLMQSGWTSRWPNSEKMFNRDSENIAHFPGWSTDVADFLISERNVKAFGHEVTDTDGGIAISKDDFSCETLILQRELYQLELMRVADEIPAKGSLIFVGAPKPKAGSGFPCRAIALVPND